MYGIARHLCEIKGSYSFISIFGLVVRLHVFHRCDSPFDWWKMIHRMILWTPIYRISQKIFPIWNEFPWWQRTWNTCILLLRREFEMIKNKMKNSIKLGWDFFYSIKFLLNQVKWKYKFFLLKLFLTALSLQWIWIYCNQQYHAFVYVLFFFQMFSKKERK